jgi:hypothetical protein
MDLLDTWHHPCPQRIAEKKRPTKKNQKQLWDARVNGVICTDIFGGEPWSEEIIKDMRQA